MLRPRITPCLLVHKGGLVKTVGFKTPKYVGDPINAVKIFNEKEADELIVLDIDATVNNTEPDYRLIANLAAECRMPLCYGGGIKTHEQAKRIIGLGVEKVAISSAAVETPELISRIADEIGRQSVVVVLDVKKRMFSEDYDVFTKNASNNTHRSVFDLAAEVERLGAGELVINSIDRDGTMRGYDLVLAEKIRRAVKIPITILGGAGSLADLEALIRSCGVLGASAGSLFVFKGPYRAVLINYPTYAQRDELIGRAGLLRRSIEETNRCNNRQTGGRKLTIGIDASNLRGGGGLTHLVELLGAAKPAEHGIECIVVWSGKPTLGELEDRPWLDKRYVSALDKGLLRRLLWQRYYLSKAARDAGCDMLFVPGGSYAGSFRPMVTMSQYLLPFEMRELKRYGWSLFAIKLLILRLTQANSFREAKGVIFLTEFARDVVSKVVGNLGGAARIIPHGLSPRFKIAPKTQCALTDYDDTHPYRILYVSSIDEYKHQWHVVDAVATLRKRGLPIVLDLIGPAYLPALEKLYASMARVDQESTWVHYHGEIPFKELHHYYSRADLGLFASSCENLPIILLETMASGLPIACSKKQPMKDILGDAGMFFDPEQPSDIAGTLSKLMESPQLRADLAKKSYERAQQFTWQRCADETLEFLVATVDGKGKTKELSDV